MHENPQKAYEYFINEIQNSDDLDKVALCGSELIKALYVEEKYDEVLKYGTYILTERKAVHYTSIALDMMNSFVALSDKEGSNQFVEQLAKLAKDAIEQKDFDNALSFMKHIQVFDEKN